MGRTGRLALASAVTLGLVGMVPGQVFAGSPLACGDTLTADTTLTADLDCSAYDGTALTMGANRIHLDLGGHTITGFAGNDTDSGVSTDGYKHTVIRHGAIRDFNTGIDVEGSTGTLIKRVTISGDTATTSNDTGIYGDNSTGSKVSHNHISGVYHGIYWIDSASNTFDHNTISADNEGMYFEYESWDIVTHNTTTAAYGFYEDYGSNLRYRYNTANGGTDGFYLDCDEYGAVRLVGNTANGNSSYGYYTYYCYNSSDMSQISRTLMTGNVAANNGSEGFYDYYSVNSIWRHNLAKGNGEDGFYLYYPANLDFRWNAAKHNDGNGIEANENYSYYNFYKYSDNTANFNGGYGHYAQYGAPGTSNKAMGNTMGSCYNVVC